MQKNKTFWPYGIMISILLVVIACIITVIIGLNHPVHIDNYYFEKYQYAEENYDLIEKQNKLFESEFSLKFLAPNSRYYNPGASMLSVEITDIKANESNILEFGLIPKAQKSISDIKFEILLTKPDTNDFNQKITPTVTQNGFFVEIIPTKIGRWQLMVKLESSKDSTTFKKYELYAN